MGIINNTKSEDLLKELTIYRCMSAVPFGGRYRLIDFPMSNMVNSGIRNIGVITSHKYRSLMDHLGSGKEWGLDRKTEGLIILPPASPSVFKKNLSFDMEDFEANADYVEKSHQKYILISGNNMICNIDFREALRFHFDKGAHVTLFYEEEKSAASNLNDLFFLDAGPDGMVSAIKKVPSKNMSNKVFLEMIIMDKALLIDLIRVARESGTWELAEVLQNNIHDLKIAAFGFNGYVGRITSLESYFRCNMDLLNREVWDELFLDTNPIFTKIKDGPPTKYTADAEVTNSLVASGCNIKGKVEDSVIFRGVTIGYGTQVKNSIIMQQSEIQEQVELENVILDKEVQIRKGTVLKGKKKSPIVISKRSVI